MNVAEQQIPAGELTPGDEVYVHGTIGWQVVSAVNVYSGAAVVVYFHSYEWVYENRAREHGSKRVDRLVEKQLRPVPIGEKLRARRGNPKEAERLRARLEADQAARFKAAEERWRRDDDDRPGFVEAAADPAPFLLAVRLPDGVIHYAKPAHVNTLCGAERVSNDDASADRRVGCDRCAALSKGDPK